MVQDLAFQSQVMTHQHALLSFWLSKTIVLKVVLLKCGMLVNLIEYVMELLTVRISRMSFIVHIVQNSTSIVGLENCAFLNKKCAMELLIVKMGLMKRDAVSKFHIFKGFFISMRLRFASKAGKCMKTQMRFEWSPCNLDCPKLNHKKIYNDLIHKFDKTRFKTICICLYTLVSLAPHMDFSSYVHQYYKSGYLVYQESGMAGKVCADHMNK